MKNNRNLILNVFWIVLGAGLIGLSAGGILDSSLYSGFGGGLLVVGALQLRKTVKYRKDAAYRESVDTELHDERNRFLRMKSWSWTGYILVLTTALASLVSMILNQQQLQMFFSCSLCFIVVVYWISYLILRRKY